MAPTTPAETSNEITNDAPRRFIYNENDMKNFRHSPVRKELLSFVSAMGRGLTSNTQKSLPHGGYNPCSPLEHLTPALASLHGSLTCMSSTWMDANQGGIPPDQDSKARFGNLAFRTWHARLIQRSYGIVRCLMECHVKYPSALNVSGEAKEEILRECSESGYRVASNDDPTLWQKKISSTDPSSNQEDVIAELRAYLHDSFGHPTRIDYGTGHESSFIVFLLSLCKIGCFRWACTSSNKGCDEGDRRSKNNPSPEALGRISLSLFYAYLSVTRGLQRDYMLEPAGSHGVWGLDDYHCVPFYLGACQMMAREQWQLQNPSLRNKQGNNSQEEGHSYNNPYLSEATSTPKSPAHLDDMDSWNPTIIQERCILENHHSTYLYLSCIRFIQQIKTNVPFFESSPMLNDISQLSSWSKVSSGLLRLYEGEVLDKLPVVQHFLFGKIFSADWVPSRKTPIEAPTRDLFRAPKIDKLPGGIAPTRAPWAK